jgi:hypothetical protein
VFVPLQIQTYGELVARILKFLESSGRELHHISDPEERLPIPVTGQVVSIGPSRMWIESVTTLSDAEVPIHFVFVRSIPAQDGLVSIC